MYQKLFEELKHSSLLIFPNFRAYSEYSTVPVPCSTVPVPCITVPVPCSTVQPRLSRLQWPTQVRFHDHGTIPPADQSEPYLYPLTNQSPTFTALSSVYVRLPEWFYTHHLGLSPLTHIYIGPWVHTVYRILNSRIKIIYFKTYKGIIVS